MNRLARISVLTVFCLSMGQASIGAEWTQLQMGYNGIAKVGKWIPVSVTAAGLKSGRSVQLQASFSDPRGDICTQTIATAEVGRNGEAALHGYFCIGRVTGSGELRLVDAESGEVLCSEFIQHGEKESLRDEGEVQQSLLVYRLDVPLILTFGEVAGIDELLRNAEKYSSKTVILKGINLESPSELAPDVRSLDGVDVLFLVSSFNFSEAQRDAIRKWVHQGGDLYFSIGANVGEFLKSPTGEWLNGYFELDAESVSIRELSSLQSFVTGASRLETGRRTVPIAISRSTQNHVEVDFLSGPIVFRQSIGTGTATCVAVDLNQRPMNKWLSLPQFYEVLLLGDKLTRGTSSANRSSRISQSGVSDLSTQAMAVLDAVPEEGSWSTWSIMAMLVAWLILIGPVDYVLVTQIFRKPQITWITFPLLIAGGAGLIFWVTSPKTNDVLNQLHVVDVFEADGKSKYNVHSWMSFSSASTARRDFLAVPSLVASQHSPASLIWSGRAEDVYGGMYRTGGIGLGRQEYRFSDAEPDLLSGIPVLTKGSRQVIARWSGDSDRELVDSSLVASGIGLLKGSFRHNLPESLQDFVIVHGNRVYRSAVETSLAPGVDWVARGGNVRASDLKAYLNGAVLIKSDEPTRRSSTQEVTPYRVGSRDPMYILTTASFFDVAGGSKYVGLSQEYLRHMELSDTIRLNHAVLIGTIAAPATGLSVDGQATRPNANTTLVRMLLPVERLPAEAMARTQDEINQSKRQAEEESNK